MRLPRFSIGRLAAATVIIAAIVYVYAAFANAQKHARESKARDQYMSGEISREEARQYLGNEVDTLEMKVHSMPEPRPL